MKITYRWMKEFLNFDISPREMIDRLIAIGHEVEEVIDLGLLDNPIRIARVTKVETHPNSENLTVCTVDDGGEEPATVVCGAPNVEEGMVSVLARAGAKLPDGKTLKRAKIRGVKSEGMLMALDEMGMGSDHSGIVVLEDDAAVGEGNDIILDLEVTPNRPDCLSVFGLAHDLAAAFGEKIYSWTPRLKETYENARDMISISVKCHEDCPRYTSRVLKGIRIEPSPPWLQRRLLAVGLRPVNNIVDATNLVLMELGHPMHTFDYDKISQQQIIVRMAGPGESIKIIDGSVLRLAEGKDMLIADADGPIALAGVMGGYDSEVNEETRNILIESAYFKPSTIRLTSRRHNISTDASYRFERGTDPNGVTLALERVASLIVELTEGTIAKGVVSSPTSRPAPPKTLMLRSDRACRFLGMDISRIAIADLLAALGFEMLRRDGNMLVVSVPSHRVDVTREEDMYEEIARLHGYDKIPSTLPYLPAAVNPLNETTRVRRLLQDHLAGLGFNEAINLSFIGENHLEELSMSAQGTLKLLNPMSRDQAILRPDLTPSILRNLQYNQNRGNSNLRLFEISRTFHFGDMADPCVEYETLILALMGTKSEAAWRETATGEWDFFDMKGILESLFEGLGITKYKFSDKNTPPFLHPGRSAQIKIGREEIGWFGELNPVQRQNLGLNARPQLAQIQIEPLRARINLDRKFQDIPRYPSIDRDLALLVKNEVPASEIESVIRAQAGDLLESLFLFDCYSGERVPEGMKSLGYRAVYRHHDRTLKEEEIEAVEAKILEALSKNLGATLRT